MIAIQMEDMGKMDSISHPNYKNSKNPQSQSNSRIRISKMTTTQTTQTMRKLSLRITDTFYYSSFLL